MTVPGTVPEGPAPDLPPAGRGKVRDSYAVGEDRLLMVTSDRISAYDVVLGRPVPGKGVVLTALTQFWLEQLTDLVPGHLLAWRARDLPPAARHLAGRALLVRRLEMLPVECVARGHLIGSGWRDYQATGAVCGVPLPAGLRQADRLPDPVFTPATKATDGHDENIPFERAAELVGESTAARLRALTLAVYRHGAAHAADRGLLLADTKLEFGRDPAGRIVLADEVLTPDSSRFWPADRWQPGTSPPSFDKQYVRDWLDTLDWDRTPPAPELPDEVVAGTAARYREAYERLTGRSLDDWLAEARS